MKEFQNKVSRNQFILNILFIAIIIITSFSAGVLVSKYLPFLSAGKFRVLFEVYSILENNYLDELPSSQEFEYGMIQGMLTKVNDPYTMFVEPVQHELQTNQLEGRFGGIGARLERDAEGNLLLYPFLDSPAQNAGIKSGDTLLFVEDLQIIPEMPLDEVQAAIRGPVGSDVEMTVASPPDYVRRTIKVERSEIALPSVTWNLSPKNEIVGIVQINLIAATTPEEVKTAILDLQSNGAQYIILDLRNNSGGLLQAGVDTAKLFLNQSPILQQQYRDKPVETISSEEPGIFVDIPIAVLVNNGSASAAEIIAAALKAQNRGIIVGNKTYGKDTIQLVYDLSDGSSLHVTAARWWIPGLQESISANGLEPDIKVTEEETLQPKIFDIAIEKLVPSNTMEQ